MIIFFHKDTEKCVGPQTIIPTFYTMRKTLSIFHALQVFGLQDSRNRPAHVRHNIQTSFMFYTHLTAASFTLNLLPLHTLLFLPIGPAAVTGLVRGSVMKRPSLSSQPCTPLSFPVLDKRYGTIRIWHFIYFVHDNWGKFMTVAPGQYSFLPICFGYEVNDI